jgi:parallel beta helix pectate lyase-like protein
LATVAACAAAALTFGHAATAEAATCDKVAAPWGSDRARGNPANPYRTVGKLMDSLTFARIGCLRQGTYFEDVSITRGGLPYLPIGLRSYPGEAARLVGRLWVAEGANNVTVAGLYLDGFNAGDLPSPNVNARGVRFVANDVTNRRTTICFALGSYTYGSAYGTVIENNRIHDCGVRPPTNHHHGAYLAVSTNVTLRRNWIHDNADRGIQLYPNAQHTLVTENVIDTNGEGVIFGGEGAATSSNNLVEHNVITNSNVRHNVESYYPPGTLPGQGNMVRQNCVVGGASGALTGGVQTPSQGFVAYGNVVADPHYVDRPRRDYRLRPDSPCLSVYGAGSYVPGPPLRPPPLPANARAQLRGSVSLRVRPRTVRGPRRLRLSGRARGIGAVRGQRVRIQVRRRGAWRTVARASLGSKGRFVRRWRFRPRRGNRTLRLRAVVRGVGKSKSANVRVRRSPVRRYGRFRSDS